MDANESLAESFTYDSLNRLTEYTIAGGSTKTVSYDDLGNITFKSDVGTYSYNASGSTSVRPHAVAAIVPGGSGVVNTTYSYDDNGNMTAGNGRTTTWTSFNKVATITRGTASVAFDYNGEHTRIRQVSASATTLYITDPATGVSFEKVTGSGGSIQWNLYVRAGDRLVAQRIDATPSGGGASTVAMRYFTTDHLGSIAVITDELGAIVERLSYDAWGKRRFPNGTDDPSGSITSQTTRGFTGHEMIDEVGLVNMNGRVYDPEIGRFMSADPIVQDPTDTQSLNRYSYVSNNPLSYTDPTGYFSLGNILKIIAVVVVVILSIALGQYWAAGAATAGEAAVAVAAAGAIGGGISAGITSGGNIKAMLRGAVAGALTAGAAGGGAVTVQRVIGAGITGGVASVIQGGNFQSGFLAAGFSTIAAPYIDKVANDNILVGASASAVVGGTASVLGGGKFANGAITGAFSYAAGKAAVAVVDAKAAATQPLGYGPDESGWHDYTAGPNEVCPAALACSATEIADQLARYGVPGQDPSRPVTNLSINKVYDPRTGLYAGDVLTEISNNGLTVTNTTLKWHVFYDGQIVRTATASETGAWSVTTRGFGNNVIPGANIINQWQGPKIFNHLDQQMRNNILKHHGN